MADLDAYTSLAYAIVRVSIWVALLAAALTDWGIHRGVRSRGWQMYAALLGAVTLFVIRNFAYLGFVIEGHHTSNGLAPHTYGAFIFFSDLADAYWIFLLLAISAGLCVTRTSLGPHRGVCIAIPLIFGITSLVVDYVLFSTSGLSAFTYGFTESTREPLDPSMYSYPPPPSHHHHHSPPAEEATIIDATMGGDPYAMDMGDMGAMSNDPLTAAVVADPGLGLAYVLCSLAKITSFMLAWFYMYDTARTEWEALRTPPEAAAAAAAAAPRVPGAPVAGAGQGGAAAADAGVGHRVVPAGAALLEEGQNASHLYGDLSGQDLDAPKSVQDRLADRDKERLMRSFFYAICFYIITAMVVFFLPALVPDGGALLIFFDCLLWVFTAGLLVVFRLRESNQFLLLDEDAVAGMETTTELGVLYNDNGLSSGDGYGSAGRREPRFTLQDEEEGTGGAASGGVNVLAAQQGVVVKPLPPSSL